MLKKRNGKRSKWLSVFVVTLTLFGLIPISLPTEVHAAGTTLVTYPNPPGGAALNTDFTVKVRANGGAWEDLDEYDTTVGGYHPSHASFVYFDTDGPVDVSVTYNAGTVSTAKVRPTSKGITPAINGNTMTFTITGPTKLSVEVNGDINHNLHLFANPPEVNPPSPSDPNVIYLAPGVYNQNFTVPSGKTLYIAGGAIVKGGVFLDNATNAAVRGRGILDHPSWRGISVNYAENITIDGIIVNDYGMGGGGGDLVDLQNAKNVTVNNIKGFSYKSWTDGIDNMGSSNVTINDCFIRSGDDSMAFYTARPESNFWGNTTNITVTNMVLMPDVARPINFGTHGDPTDYEGGLLIDSISLSNIDIMLNNTGSPMSPIQFTNGDGNLIQNIQFTDIRIEDNYVNSIVNINNVWTGSQTGPGRGVKNVYFKNITYTGNNNSNSFTGYSSNRKVEDVTFENLVVNGNLILTNAAGKMNINSNASDIQVVAPGGASYTPIPVPTPLYTNLALNATATSDSEKSGNPASSGNDGNHLTNWTANDTNTGHWWKVDLGSNKEIHGTKVIWDANNINHLYKVEVSTDDTNWATVADRTASNSTFKTNNDLFNATARYVRITITGVSSGGAASFNEFRVLQYNGSSLVKNGDFENGHTATWTGNGMLAHISAAVNSTFGLDLRSPGNYAEQTITGLSPNTSYILTVDAKGVSGTGRGNVYVKDYGAAQINKGIISDNTFHSTSIIFVTGSNSTTAKIGVSDTAGRIQFDNFVLKRNQVLVLLTLMLDRAADIEIDYYTTVSAEAFQAAVTHAKLVAADADASQEEIDAAAASLQAALEGLVYIEGLPVIAPVEDQTVLAENSLTFQVQSSIKQLTDVAFSVGELPEGATFDAETQIFAWTPGKEQGGVYVVTFTATSGELSFSRTVRITVIGQPAIDSESVVELTAREPFTYHVAASDPLGAVLSYSAKNLPAGAKFEEATGVLAWTPEQVNYGSNLVTFTVSNESFAVSKTVDFKVKLYLIPSESYTQGSYYLYMKEVERIESEMNEPDADKTKLAAELAQAEGALVPLSEHAEQISVTESMVTASHRSWDKRYNAAQNGWHAMDGNTSTFTDTERNPGWILVDLGEDNEQTVGSFKLYPRTNYQSRMNGAVIQGSNDGTNFDDLYTVSGITGNGWYTFVIDNNTTAYRYLRLYSSNGNANAAEIEYYKIDNTLIPILLEEAEAIDTELYTEESVQPLQAAVSNAESVYTNADASQEEIDAASASLLAALQGLQWKDITAAVEPVEPNGNNGWYTSPVTVTLSPAKIAEYSLDGGSSWTAFSEPVTLSEEGVHQVLYRRSVDTGETESLEFKIDLTAPQVTVTGDTYYTIDQEIVITCSTTDETSSVYGTPCDQPLIQVKAYTLASGENTATVTVEDMAGHQKTVTHTFTVAVTFDSLKNVTNAFLQETGAKAWESVAESYNNKLDLAKEKAKSGKIEAARGIIDGFIDQVTDQTGNFFTKEQSDILIRWAQIVI